MCARYQSEPEVIAGVWVVGLAVSRIPARLSVAPTSRRRLRIAGDGRRA